jgi:tRNA pseudouridine55 synthase
MLMNPNEGILLVDKPTGITSHDVVDVVRKKLSIRRVGHTGTLDPLATGLLIILVGRQYTKRQAEFLKQDKQYQVSIKLGSETDSYDSDGKVLKLAKPASLKKITKEKITTALKNFQGEIKQTVPSFSAVKINGKKLYELARQKQTIAKLPERTVSITGLKLVSFDSKTSQLELLVDCSSGTYIRSLAHDLGQVLKVGAHVTGLRRTKIGSLSVNKAISLEDFENLALAKVPEILIK